MRHECSYVPVRLGLRVSEPQPMDVSLREPRQCTQHSLSSITYATSGNIQLRCVRREAGANSVVRRVVCQAFVLEKNYLVFQLQRVGSLETVIYNTSNKGRQKGYSRRERRELEIERKKQGKRYIDRYIYKYVFCYTKITKSQIRHSTPFRTACNSGHL